MSDKSRMPMTRIQRIQRLVTLSAPHDLIENEIRLAVREHMDADIKNLSPAPMVWVTTVWALFAEMNAWSRKCRYLEKELRKARREVKAKEPK
jgi:hypothetical protein